MTDWSEHEFANVVEKAKALRSMVNIVEVAELLGFEVDHNGKIPSPWNLDERTPSCHLYVPDHFFDFSSGNGGDSIDLVQAVQQCTWGQAVHRLWTRGLRAGFEPGRFEAVAKPEPADLSEDWWHMRDATDLNEDETWATKLGLPVPCLLALWDRDHIAFDRHGMQIAHWHDGKVRGIKTRQMDGAKGSVTGSQYTHGLYTSSLHESQRDAEVAVICEGESDAWALSWHWCDDPVHIFALPSGAGLWRDEWLESLAAYKAIYLAFDNDQAGQKARDKVMRAVGYGRAHELRVPGLYNDVREAYVAGWRPEVPGI